MFPIKPTDTLAPDQLARYVRAIEPGGSPYPFKGFDQNARAIDLNDDYKRGVVVREFSNRPYKNAASAALVFSSSLLHELEETTKAVRYKLISHFFDDASLQQAKGR